MSEVREGEPLAARVDGVPVAVFRVGDGCYAVHDVCTHEYARLSDGYQDGEIVECPLHQAQFDVRTGKVVLEPAREDVHTYPVRIDGEDLLIDVSPAG